MHDLNQRGFKAFSQENFEQAALYFAAAYEAYPDPNLRKNEAIAWLKHGNCTRARPAARIFLNAKNTTAKDRKDTQKVLSRCTIRLAQQAHDDKKTYEARLYLDEAKSMSLSAEDQATYIKLRQQLEPIKPPNQTQQQKSTAPAWTLLGVGVATVTGAIIYHNIALNDSQALRDISNHGGSQLRYDQLSGRLSVARIMVPVLYAAGLTMSGVGAYMLLTPQFDAPASTPQSSRHADHVGAKLHIRFRF